MNLLKIDHYKLMPLIGVSKRVMRIVEAVLDTGAGPNLVRESILPRDWLRYRTEETNIPPIRDANDRKLRIEGVVRLYVDIGGQSLRLRFLVCKDLAVKAILGCDFIHRHVQAILPQKGEIILKDGGCATILRRNPQIAALIHKGTAPTAPYRRGKRLNRRDREGVIRLAKPLKVSALSESLAEVRTEVRGIHKVVPAEKLMRRHKVSIPHGIIDPRPGMVFTIKVANFSRKEVILRKGTIVGTAKGRPKLVICPAFLSRTNSRPALSADSTPWMDEADLSHLDEKTFAQLRKLLLDYEDICDGRLGSLKGVEHRIELVKDTKPIFQQPYRCGIERRKAEEAEVQRMLAAEVIEPSTSEWASPVILVPKPDGSLRFCVDYRKLNAVTKRDSYPMPRMDDCIDSLGNATLFTTLDCNSGYWQLPIAKEDQEKTTFTCHAGSYRWLRLPFGLRNAPATFQRAMDIILSSVKWRFCLVYLDDIIVFSSTKEEHLRHLRSVFQLLREAGATLRLQKCDFFKKKVKYLGHEILPGKLKILPKNLEAIARAKAPTTKTQVRSFLGMCNMYRRFIAGYAQIAFPLFQKTCKNEPDAWENLTDTEMDAFQTLRRCLLTAPILALPREGFPYTLDTDASAYQVGCCLLQEQSDGTLHPIGYWSRTLSAAEKNYSSTEKECLAIVWAVLHLRPYLEGSRFTIRTDHDALKWLMNLRDPRGRLARWALRLQEFDYEIQYKPGSSHALADGPSRLLTDGIDQSHFDDDIPCLPRRSNLLTGDGFDVDDAKQRKRSKQDTKSVLVTRMNLKRPINVEETLEEQAKDKYCRWVRKQIAEGNDEKFVIDQHGVLTRRSPLDQSLQMIVPESLKERLLDVAHSAPTSAHPGRSKMYQTLRRHFYWPSMTVDIHQWVDRCDACARNRIKGQKNVYKMKLFPPSKPLEYVAMDILGPLPRTKAGKRFILVITDRFTKLTKTEALRTITALSVAKAFCRTWVYNFGTPKIVLTDNGSQFASRFFLQVCKILGIHKVFTTEYHPQTNGQAERFNRTILASLRDYVSESQKDWDEWLEPLTYAYNCQVHRSTGMTPFNLVLSRHPPPLVVEEDLIDHEPSRRPQERRRQLAETKEKFLLRLHDAIKKANLTLSQTQRRYKRDYDRRVRRRLANLRVGDYVYREIPEHPAGVNPKLASPVDGPFEILDIQWPTIIISKDGRPIRVNASRVTKAGTTPPPNPDAPAESPTEISPLPEDNEDQPPLHDSPVKPTLQQESQAQSRRKARHQARDGRQLPPNSPPMQHTPESAQPNEEFEVERIVDAGLTEDGQEVYRIRWRGYPPNQDTWEPAHNLPEILIRAYKHHHNLA